MTTKKAGESAEGRTAPAAATDADAAQTAAARTDEAGEAREAGEAHGGEADTAFDHTPSSADYSTAFSPRNVAVGLAIVAGIVAFVASRRRKQSGRGDG